MSTKIQPQHQLYSRYLGDGSAIIVARVRHRQHRGRRKSIPANISAREGQLVVAAPTKGLVLPGLHRVCACVSRDLVFFQGIFPSKLNERNLNAIVPS